MPERMRFNDQVTAGPQPSERELESLPQRWLPIGRQFPIGWRGRPATFAGEEGEKVKAAGMSYLHVPVSMDGMDMSQVDEFRKRYTSLSGRISGATPSRGPRSVQVTVGSEAFFHAVMPPSTLATFG